MLLLASSEASLRTRERGGGASLAARIAAGVFVPAGQKDPPRSFAANRGGDWFMAKKKGGKKKGTKKKAAKKKK